MKKLIKKLKVKKAVKTESEIRLEKHQEIVNRLREMLKEAEAGTITSIIGVYEKNDRSLTRFWDFGFECNGNGVGVIGALKILIDQLVYNYFIGNK